MPLATTSDAAAPLAGPLEAAAARSEVPAPLATTADAPATLITPLEGEAPSTTTPEAPAASSSPPTHLHNSPSFNFTAPSTAPAYVLDSVTHFKLASEKSAKWIELVRVWVIFETTYDNDGVSRSFLLIPRS